MHNFDHRPRRRLRLYIAIVAGAVLAATAAAVAVHAATPAASRAAKAPMVKVRKTSIGKILVDSRGRTLYMFAIDRKGKSVCYGKCATDWPPMYVSAKAKVRVAGGARAKLLGKTKRRDGRFQVTYRTHPLYVFKFDAEAGQLNGQNYLGDGGKWYVISPAGRVIKKQVKAAASSASTTTTTTTTTTPYGGGGGDTGGGGGGGAAWG